MESRTGSRRPARRRDPPLRGAGGEERERRVRRALLRVLLLPAPGAAYFGHLRLERGGGQFSGNLSDYCIIFSIQS